MAENAAETKTAKQGIPSADDKITSPEQLNDYLRVTNPRVWVVFVVVILIMIAFVAWSFAGTIETLTDAKAVITGGRAELIVLNAEPGSVKKGMTVRVGKDEYEISEVSEDEYGRVIAYAPIGKDDGSYDAKIVTESITPISFLLQK